MNPLSKYSVIGHPIGHSMSPFIHQRLFAAQHADAVYFAKDIPPVALPAELPLLLQTSAGFNVTIPYKQAVIPFLDGLKGRAELYRSVNTVAVTAGGRYGYNTDADGFLRSLNSGGIQLRGRVALLGCGGVGRTFACEAALAGCSIVNAVREPGRAKAEELRRFVRKLAPAAAYEIVPLQDIHGDFDLMVNATPVGMYPDSDRSPVPASALAHTAAVFDAVYNPGDTLFLRYAAANGARAVGGMPMLVWQAVKAHEIWYGAQFPAAAVTQLIDEAEREMKRRFAD